jgi:nucleoside 2-deoxyribosyltransferase
MKAYIAIKFEQEKNKELIESISKALEKCGIESFCFVRDFENYGNVVFSPEELMKKAFEEVRASDVVVVELTKKGVGIGIEAGYAYSLDIPILTIAKKGFEISKTLEGISDKCFYYETPEEFYSIFNKYFHST